MLAGICSDGVQPSLQIAGEHPERVLGVVAIAPGVPALAPPHPWRGAAQARWDEELDEPTGWEQENRHYIRANQRAFLEFFFGEMFPEPHSTKQVEDAVAYGLDGSVEALLMDDAEPVCATKEEAEALCRRVRCPVLVVQGDRDNCQPAERGHALAALTGAEHVELAGAGHIPMARDPVVVNRLIHDFAARLDAVRRGAATGSARRTGAARTARLLADRPRPLLARRRDRPRAARAACPGSRSSGSPRPRSTTLLEACGETVIPPAPRSPRRPPASTPRRASTRSTPSRCCAASTRSSARTSWSSTTSSRRSRSTSGSPTRRWEVDYFLHENPELKTAPYAWLTDFVGVLPMPGGGEREAFLAADTNAQMVEHVARHPRLRDRSIFIGDPDDIVPEPLGPGLPQIRAWTEERFRFSGYVTGFDPAEIADRDALRAEFGFAPGEQVCLVAPGGSGAGIDLLARAAAAFPEAKLRVPELRMILIAGPRIDPASLPRADGLEIQGYVHRLYRQLAACDLAITHGGLATTMELTAAGRPFLSFPLRDHFEQNRHVAHRLDRHGAGLRMDYHRDGPAEIAAAIAEEIGREPRYRPVEQHGAARAAAAIGELL